MPRAIESDPNQNDRFSDRWVEDAGFLRLKNLQIGYSLSPDLVARSKAFKTARLYVGATNLFTITKYKGLDPEVITFNDVSRQVGAGTDRGSTPQPRTFQVGFQVGF
jgi:hypothetical protein